MQAVSIEDYNIRPLASFDGGGFFMGKRRKIREELTFGDVEKYLELVKASNSGDQGAAKQLAELEDLAEYQAAASDLKQLMENVSKNLSDLYKSMDMKEFGIKPLLDNINAEFSIQVDAKSLQDLISAGESALRPPELIKNSGFKLPEIASRSKGDIKGFNPFSDFYVPRPNDRVADLLAEGNRLYEQILEELERIREIEESRTKKTRKAPEQERGVGRPGLEINQLVYRLAKAQLAEDIRREKPEKTWKEIAIEIEWPHGSNKAGVKLLEDARYRLKRLKDSDPNGLLKRVDHLIGREGKEKN